MDNVDLPTLADYVWPLLPGWRVRSDYSFVRIPHATINSHDGARFTVYTDADALDIGDRPTCVVTRSDGPGEPVHMVETQGYGPEAVTVAVAELALHERQSRCRLVGGDSGPRPA